MILTLSDLKSSMERFIGDRGIICNYFAENLKSSMERFIAETDG